MCWFVIYFHGAHPGTDNRWHGPFYGDLAAARLFRLALRQPAMGIPGATEVHVLQDGMWRPIDEIADKDV